MFKRSVEKWKKIEKRILAKGKHPYNFRYWKKCGFCVVKQRMEYKNSAYICPLNKLIKRNTHICGGCNCNSIITSSYGKDALAYADRKNWYPALRKCRAFINQMEKAIKNL